MIRGSSIFDIVASAICALELIGITVYLLAVWGKLPDLIPGHYNMAGEVTRWDGKGTLILLLAITWGLFILITIVERIPQFWNTAGIKITEENGARLYKIMRRMLSTIKLITVTALVYLTLHTTFATSLPVWFTPVFLFICLGPVLYFTVRLYRAR